MLRNTNTRQPEAPIEGHVIRGSALRELLAEPVGLIPLLCGWDNMSKAWVIGIGVLLGKTKKKQKTMALVCAIEAT